MQREVGTWKTSWAHSACTGTSCVGGPGVTRQGTAASGAPCLLGNGGLRVPPCWKGKKTLLGVKWLQEVCRPIWIETCFSALCDLEQVWPLP